MSKKPVISRTLIYGLVFLIFYLPVLMILGKAFLSGNVFAEFSQFISSRLFLNTLSFSIKEAFVSAFFSLLLALPGAYFFGRFDFRGKNLMRSMMVLPFMFPGILVVLGMIIFYGNNGLFNQLIACVAPQFKWQFNGLYGFWGIIIAHVLYNFTFCLRMLGESWQRIDPKLVEASGLLGARSFQTWLRITFPLLMPTLAYLFALVFIYSFLSFTIVLVLGGYLYKTFEVLIYIEYNQKLDFNRAAVIVMIQTVLLGVFLYGQAFLSRKTGRTGNFTLELPKLNKRRPFYAGLFVSYLVVMIFFLLGPLFTILGRSFRTGTGLGGQLSLNNYRLLFSDGFRFAVGQNFGKVIGTSCFVAIIVTFITIITAYWFARDRRKLPWQNFDLWLQLPLGISFLTFAFGVLLLAGAILPIWLMVVWAQFFTIFPFVYSQLKTARQELDESLLEAAATLGASKRTIFWSLEFPLMKKAVGTATVYAIALSLGDLTAVLTLGQGSLVTIPVAIYRLIGHYRFPQATALGSIFILAAFLLFVSLEAFQLGEKEIINTDDTKTQRHGEHRKN